MAKWVGYRHQTAQDQSKSKQTSSFVSSTINYLHGLFVVFCFVLHFNLKFYRRDFSVPNTHWPFIHDSLFLCHRRRTTLCLPCNELISCFIVLLDWIDSSVKIIFLNLSVQSIFSLDCIFNFLNKNDVLCKAWLIKYWSSLLCRLTPLNR